MVEIKLLILWKGYSALISLDSYTNSSCLKCVCVSRLDTCWTTYLFAWYLYERADPITWPMKSPQVKDDWKERMKSVVQFPLEVSLLSICGGIEMPRGNAHKLVYMLRWWTRLQKEDTAILVTKEHWVSKNWRHNLLLFCFVSRKNETKIPLMATKSGIIWWGIILSQAGS